MVLPSPSSHCSSLQESCSGRSSMVRLESLPCPTATESGEQCSGQDSSGLRNRKTFLPKFSSPSSSPRLPSRHRLFLFSCSLFSTRRVRVLLSDPPRTHVYTHAPPPKERKNLPCERSVSLIVHEVRAIRHHREGGDNTVCSPFFESRQTQIQKKYLNRESTDGEKEKTRSTLENA